MTESPTFVSLAVIASLLTSTAPPWADAPAGRYILVEGDTAVKDTVTGLVWMRSERNGTYTWANAKSACPAGWRLPNVMELTDLVDQAKTSPAIDTTFFQGAAGSAPRGTSFWSSSPYALSPGNAWQVSFYRFGVQYVLADGTTLAAVRCVR